MKVAKNPKKELIVLDCDGVMLNNRKVDFSNLFKKSFFEKFPVMPGALEAAQRLSDLGYEIVCVTNISPMFKEARLKNLRSLGFNIEKVICTGGMRLQVNPKKSVINHMSPKYFVDNFSGNFISLKQDVKCVLINKDDRPKNSKFHKVCSSLHDFVDKEFGF